MVVGIETEQIPKAIIKTTIAIKTIMVIKIAVVIKIIMAIKTTMVIWEMAQEVVAKIWAIKVVKTKGEAR
jgi:hypothetical protein